MGPDTLERIDKASVAAAQEVYRLIHEDTEKLAEEIRKVREYLADQEARKKGTKRGIFNAIKHGIGVATSEIDKLMKD